ncbi:hypothetical protein [Nocardia sp. NPDC050710]|uniref:hypothetical protein n=1 Tax=Nocardia sp. NPDC050710 TaxID=3157220 RepID=UPI0033C257B6
MNPTGVPKPGIDTGSNAAIVLAIVARSIAWGELRASAVFHTDLRERLAASTHSWNTDIETSSGKLEMSAP